MIKTLPLEENPREKALTYGIETLNNVELLALILRTGHKNESVIQLSQRLLTEIGGFANLSTVTYADLIALKGIKQAKAIEILSIIEIAKRLKAFDCKVIGLKRTLIDIPEYVDELHTMDKLDEILPQGDFVILCLPQSQETINLFNKKRLLLMKKDAVLVNVGRGSAINTNDLKEVLDLNHLYGVALDVIDPEPYPENSDLWNYDNVFITPHVSGGFVWKSVHEYFLNLVIRNIKHLDNNEPLENEVDFTSGYRKIVKYN